MKNLEANKQIFYNSLSLYFVQIKLNNIYLCYECTSYNNTSKKERKKEKSEQIKQIVHMYLPFVELSPPFMSLLVNIFHEHFVEENRGSKTPTFSNDSNENRFFLFAFDFSFPFSPIFFP